MRLGVIYNLVKNINSGRAIDAIADNECEQVAIAVRDVLSKKYSAELIDITDLNIEQLRNFDFISNLADSDGIAESEIAASLEKLNIPFSGSGAYALRLCLDKAEVKRLLLKKGVNTPRFQVFKERNNLECILKFPLIVKPVHEDGSKGIDIDSVVFDYTHLEAKVGEILEAYKQGVLVEEFIDGREINAALIGNGDLRVLPLSEINYTSTDGSPRVLTYNAKWDPSSLEYRNTMGRCPIEVSETIEKKIIDYAKKAFRITGCSDYARVDFRIRGEEVYVLEVNPNPCINPHDDAGFIGSARVAGYSYDDLINEIFRLARVRNNVKV